jgi:ribonuclease P protein component
MRPRLRRNTEFDLVYTRGRKFSAPALVLFLLESAPDHRVAFVASRKVGGAVQRNRAKRLLRAALGSVEEDAPEVRGWLVLIARRDILKCKTDQVADQLRGLLGRHVSSAETPRQADGAPGGGGP